MIGRMFKLFNMTFDSDAVSEDWRSAAIVPMYRIKGRGLNVKLRDNSL